MAYLGFEVVMSLSLNIDVASRWKRRASLRPPTAPLASWLLE